MKKLIKSKKKYIVVLPNERTYIVGRIIGDSRHKFTVQQDGGDAIKCFKDKCTVIAYNDINIEYLNKTRDILNTTDSSIRSFLKNHNVS